YSPITNMHLSMIEQAKNHLMYSNSFPLDIIAGIISPVHDLYGKKSLIPSHHRIKMCELATEDSSWISVSSWEIQQHNWTRTAETLAKYQEIFNSSHYYDRPCTGIIIMWC